MESLGGLEPKGVYEGLSLEKSSLKGPKLREA